MVSHIIDLIVHFKRSSLGKEWIKSELLRYGLGSKAALQGTVKTKRRAEGLRKQISCALGKKIPVFEIYRCGRPVWWCSHRYSYARYKWGWVTPEDEELLGQKVKGSSPCVLKPWKMMAGTCHRGRWRFYCCHQWKGWDSVQVAGSWGEGTSG